MKKIIFTLLSFVLLLTSCDLEKLPSGTIPLDGSITSVSDAENFRNGIYLSFRGMNGGSFAYIGEIASDFFNPSINYGNREGDTYKWKWASDNGTAEGIWGSCYGSIASANYFIEEIDLFLKNSPELSEKDKDLLSLYRSEAYFLKAYAMYELVIRYCNIYNPGTATVDMGVMIVDKFMPTSDHSTYPGRSSLQESYDKIDEYLVEAAKGLQSVSGVLASKYLTIDALNAFKARLALMKGKEYYREAATLAETLISSNKYPLVESEEDFQELWMNDSGKECIMQLYADYATSSLPASYDPSYVGDKAVGESSIEYSPDWILSAWVTGIYSPSDLRNAWLSPVTLTYGNIKGDAVILEKFPGNRELQDPTLKISNHIQKVKPFRIAEQYLIAAEAYAGMNDDVNAQKYLDELRGKRDASYTSTTYSHEDLLEEIKMERVKELIGEGFRFFDLKRYGKGFERTGCQNPDITHDPEGKGSSLLKVLPTNKGFLWPIPQYEIDSNPQIKHQQNADY